MLIIVMGVAGSGKTTVGRALATRLEAFFLDADDFHPPANVAKMSSGEPLTDDDRWPWLEGMHTQLKAVAIEGRSAVLACSALKRAYREKLHHGLAGVRWVYLRISRSAAKQRMADRRDHFMPPALIDSQFDTLEEPSDALVVDAEMVVEKVVDAIVETLEACA